MLRFAVLACVALAASAFPYGFGGYGAGYGAGLGYAGYAGGAAFPYGGGFQIAPAPLNDPLAEFRNAEGTAAAAAANGIARGQALAASTTANANNHADAIASAIQFQSAQQSGAAILSPGHPNPSGMAIYGQGAGHARLEIPGNPSNIYPNAGIF